MTKQYEQSNINLKGNAAVFVSAVGAGAYSIDSGTTLLTVDSDAEDSTITLPPISVAGDCKIITVYNEVAGSTTVAAAAGDAISIGASPNPILLEGGSLTLISNASTGRWYVVGVTV